MKRKGRYWTIFGGIFRKIFGTTDSLAYREVRFGPKSGVENQKEIRFCNNAVATAKYNLISFLPRYFWIILFLYFYSF